MIIDDVARGQVQEWVSWKSGLLMKIGKSRKELGKFSSEQFSRSGFDFQDFQTKNNLTLYDLLVSSLVSKVLLWDAVEELIVVVVMSDELPLSVWNKVHK